MVIFLTYEEAATCLLELPRFTKKNEPSHTEEFMRLLGNPQDRFAYIHVAGSNGKGSVCAYLTQVLIESGIRVGTFTSPHLVDLRERFCLQGEMCSRQQFLFGFDKEQKAGEVMQAEGLPHPTFFEYVYAMAMVLFAREGAACAVVETGLGGRLDATNVRKNPTLTVITSISLEHTEILGDTIGQIAAEKAGIIKPGAPVVFDGNDREASAVIRERAKAVHAPAVEITWETINILLKTGKKIDFSLDSGYDVTSVEVSATAPYQVMNGALALAAVNELRDRQNGKPAGNGCFERMDADAVARGFSRAFWPGRMEEVLPEVYLDGAHNVAGILAFLEGARELAREKAVLLFSMVQEKDYEKVAGLLWEAGLWEEIILTEIPRNPRALKPDCLQEVFVRAARDANKGTARTAEQVRIRVIGNVGEAWKEALARKKQGQKLFCVGSLYLIGALKQEVEDRRY